MEVTLAAPRVDYLNVRHTVASWLLTKDHKRIGIMYLVVVSLAFFVGGLFASLIRFELATPAAPTPTTSSSRCTAWRWSSSS
jgi:cytochrome c oxidase subunit 1